MTDSLVNQTLKETMTAIVGCQLSSITFVADYVQFAFDGPCLTAYTSPVVKFGSRCLQWGEAGYRDALCDQIGHVVRQVKVDDQHVSLLFEGDAFISISLLDQDYTGPEALVFSLNRERVWVV